MKVSGKNVHAARKISGHIVDIQAEEVLDLGAGDQRAMPLVKPTTTGRGMNLTALPSPRRAEQNQEQAGHSGNRR